MSKRLKNGDYIECKNQDEMVVLHYGLKDEHIRTEYVYEKDGKKGFWLKVKRV